MRIAQIDTVYEVGSTGKIVQSIHNNLLSYGHESKVYYGRGTESSDPGVIKISSDFEVIVDAGLSRISGYTGIFSPVATKKIISDLEQFNPDVIHLHEIHGYYLNYFKVFEYIKERRIPVLWTLHCEMAFTGRCGNTFDCEQWKTTCKKCPQLNDYPSSLFFDRSYVQFERKRKLLNEIEPIIFAPVSNWLNDRLKNSFLGKKSSHVVYNGLNTSEVFLPLESGRLSKLHKVEGRYVVLSVAQNIMSARKGGEWILEIAKSLKDLPITFIMIGVNERPIDCPSNVICLPPISNPKQLAEYYSLADLFLITSQSETFSLTCAESLACGTPIAGFDSGGPKEIAPEPYGRFVPYGDIHNLLNLIISLFNRSLMSPTCDDCVNYVRSKFCNEHMFENYLMLYERLIRLGKKND